MSDPQADNWRMENITNFKPSAFFFRQALRRAKDLPDAVAIGMTLVLELEAHKEFIRSLGHVPPKRFLTVAEVSEKDWARDLKAHSQVL